MPKTWESILWCIQEKNPSVVTFAIIGALKKFILKATWLNIIPFLLTAQLKIKRFSKWKITNIGYILSPKLVYICILTYYTPKLLWTKYIFEQFFFHTPFQYCLLQNGPIRLVGGQFGCPFCSKVQNSKGDMNRHIKTHTGEKPYICDFCNYSSNQITNLKRHMERKHEKTFSLVKNVQFANL